MMFSRLNEIRNGIPVWAVIENEKGNEKMDDGSSSVVDDDVSVVSLGKSKVAGFHAVIETFLTRGLIVPMHSMFLTPVIMGLMRNSIVSLSRGQLFRNVGEFIQKSRTFWVSLELGLVAGLLYTGMAVALAVRPQTMVWKVEWNRSKSNEEDGSGVEISCVKKKGMKNAKLEEEVMSSLGSMIVKKFKEENKDLPESGRAEICANKGL